MWVPPRCWLRLAAVVVGLGAALPGIPRPVAGQFGEQAPDVHDDLPRWELGLFLLLANPSGEFEQYVDVGGGFAADGLYFLDDGRTFAIRADLAWILYGSQTVRRPLSPTVPFVAVDVTTRNSIASWSFGPHVELGSGAFRPYGFGSVGFSYFTTDTQVEGSRDTEPFATTKNFDDFTLAWAGGGGFKVQLKRGHTPVALDFSAQYVRNGLTRYLREGSLRELPGGGWTADPIESETNLWSFRLGVSLGLRGEDPHQR